MSHSDPIDHSSKTRHASLEAITLRCLAGDPQAWASLVEHFERPLYYYACRLLSDRDRALGALQDAWVRAFESVHTLRDAKRVAPWLYTLVRRSVQAEMGHRGRRPEVALPMGAEDAELDPAEDAPEDGIDPWHDTEALHAALLILSPASAEILTLFFLQDLTQSGVAEVLGIPVGTVKSRLYHAKRELRLVLRPDPRSTAPKERSSR